MNTTMWDEYEKAHELAQDTKIMTIRLQEQLIHLKNTDPTLSKSEKHDLLVSIACMSASIEAFRRALEKIAPIIKPSKSKGNRPMEKVSDKIERVMHIAGRTLVKLIDLSVELDALKDSRDPFIGDQEKRMLGRYNKHASKMATKTDEIRGYLASLYEAAAWIEEEEKAEQ